MFQLDEKVVLVTGAATGIGLSIASLFACRGAIVTMMDRDGNLVSDECARLRGQGLQVDAAACDVRDGDAIAQVVNGVLKKQRRIDVLVSNAGVIHVGTILETEPEEFRNVMAVNVEGPYRIIRACLPSMKERKSGTILQIASVSALAPLRSRFVYAVSKAASQMIVRSVANDMAEFGIRANAICPARVHTQMVDNALRDVADGHSDQETLASLHALQPLGRMIRTDEVAALALYLCSDEAAMVTGASYLIDGGLLAGV